MSDRYLRELVGHLKWADERVWEAVLASEAAATDESLRAKLHHLHTVQRAFLNLWQGVEVNVKPLSDFADLAAYADFTRETHQQIDAFLSGVNEVTLNSELPIAWATRVEKLLGRPAAAVSVRQSVVQVAMHSAYHRGQVNMRLRELGGEPPLVDFIAWIWMGKP